VSQALGSSIILLSLATDGKVNNALDKRVLYLALAYGVYVYKTHHWVSETVRTLLYSAEVI